VVVLVDACDRARAEIHGGEGHTPQTNSIDLVPASVAVKTSSFLPATARPQRHATCRRGASQLKTMCCSDSGNNEAGGIAESMMELCGKQGVYRL
jgi:hypothetical protein